ncbi:MAG: hypothetical protein CMG35_10590 [Candidatus Marinimicrobia bacterium]|jgi:hypothetical protein|nr:hypothetical protein [Candidatus Neomarinimicrobiota bacterium]|tara:strand:+ start:3630 stop:4634 length:1005 start_codon:yes stop_codon:yes gene_type:complete
MAEQEQRQEYELPDISEEQIEKAAMPVGKRADEEVSEETQYIELEENKDGLKPLQEDTIQENFETSPKVIEDTKEKSEVEKKAAIAQNRINKAVAQAKDFQRRELMAIQYAKTLKEENDLLKASKQTFEKDMFESRKGETEAAIELAKQAHKQAIESNDADSIARATEALSTAIAEKKYIEASEARSRMDNIQTAPAEESPISETQPEIDEYAQPSPKAQAWANRNDWFGQDRIMTNVALSIHENLANEGFDLNSDEYYNELDDRLKQELPNKFKNVEADQKPVQTVASPSRTTSSGRKPSNRVELSPSEQRLAKRLGVSFKDYAIQKARLQKS